MLVPLIHRRVGGDNSNGGWHKCNDDEGDVCVSDDDECNSFLNLGLLLALSASTNHDDGKVDLWRDWKKGEMILGATTMVDAAMVMVVVVTVTVAHHSWSWCTA